MKPDPAESHRAESRLREGLAFGVGGLRIVAGDDHVDGTVEPGEHHAECGRVTHHRLVEPAERGHGRALVLVPAAEPGQPSSRELITRCYRGASKVSEVITVLSGGVGAARLLRALSDVVDPSELTAVVV